ncbi:MAG: polyhydroxyalkanoic acid system family protein [Pirellulales bacterium]|nr:polyhydroxyalkanoic acid system family protein [Pirellulales bacterium]
MPKFSMAIPHCLTEEEATQRLRTRFDELRQQHGHNLHEFHGEWNGGSLLYRFKAMGVQVSGAVNVEASQVRVDAELPMFAMMFKGKIEQEIRNELGNVLT